MKGAPRNFRRDIAQKGVPSIVQKEPRETAGGTLSEVPSFNNAANDEGSFQVDLGVHGVSQRRHLRRRGADDRVETVG